MILVVGATGLLGGKITHRLLDAGHEVSILVRPQSAYAPLVDAGARPVFGDLKDPASLVTACEGSQTVITTANAAQRGGDDTVETVDLAGNHALIDAAETAGVERFIFISALGADPSSPVPFLRAKGEAEARLRESQMSHTILEPNLYMDIWLPMIIGMPLQQGRPVTLIGEGQRKHSMIAVNDVAAFVAAVHDRPEAVNQTIPLGGPEAVSWRDIVATTERVLGRDIPVETLPVGSLLPGLPDVVNGLMAASETYDSPIDMTTVASTYGVELTTVEAWLGNFFGAGSSASPA